MDTSAAASAITAKNEIFFVNAGLQDLSTLLDGLPEGADVVLLDESQDGLQQMAEYLQGRQELTAIHLLSHGAQGAVQAGSTWLNSANLAEHQAALQSIGAALGEEGDLLLYGCDTAATGVGEAFVRALAEATGADVAASRDLTGSAGQGGNWALEFHQGRVDATSLSGLAAYAGLLAAPITQDFDGVALGDLGGTFSFGTPGAPRTIGGWTFTLLNAAGTQDLSQNAYVDVTNDPAVTSLANGNDKAAYLNGSYAAGTGNAAAVLKATSGEEFSFVSIRVETGASAGSDYRLVGYLNGSTVAGAFQNFTSGAYGSGGTDVAVSGSAWQYVDEVRIVRQSGHTDISIYVDDIVVTTAVLPPPAITNATYNGSTGVLAVTGSNFEATAGAGNDIVANKLTITGEGGTTYTLTDTSNVEISSSTSFLLTLSAADKAAVDQIVNKNNTSSTGGTTYNLAGAAGFVAAHAATADVSGNSITVSNVAVPTITSSTYDASTGVLVVTGTGLKKLTGAANDIAANRFTFSGEGGATYTLTNTSDVDVTSGSSFTLTLSATDKAGVGLLLNKNGSSAIDAIGYNLAAAEDWARGADAAVVVADTTGNGIVVTGVVDPAPAVSSITCLAPTSTNASSVSYLVTFSKTVTGVDTSDFTLTTTGSAAGTIAGITGGGSQYTVTLNDVSGAGTLRLDLKGSGTGITDSMNTPAPGYTAGDVYTIDTVWPVVSSVAAPPNATYVAGQHLDFTINFSEPVTVDTIDGTPRIAVTLDTGGTTYASYASGSGSTALIFRVVIQTGWQDLNGISLGSTMDLNGGSLQDAVGNNALLSLNSVGSTAGVLVDAIAPAVSSISLVGTANTNSSSVQYTVVFSEAVSGLDASDFTLIGNGVTGAVASVTGSSSTYSVTVNNVSGTGTLRLDFNSSGTGVTDVPGNPIAAGYTAGAVYSIDTDAPAAPVITALDAASDTGVSSLDGITSNATPTLTGTAEAGAFVRLYGADGTVLLGTASADGGGKWSITSNILSEGDHTLIATATDAVGNVSDASSELTITIDTTEPTITGSTVVFSDDTGSSATDLITQQAGQTEIRGTLDGTLASNETVMVSLDNGVNWISATAAGSNWTIGARTLVGSDTIKVYVEDRAGNTGSTASFSYVLDQAGPDTTFDTIRFSDDSGISNIDLKTNGDAQTISTTLSMAPAAGEKVFASLDGGDNWIEVTSQVSGTTLTWTGVTLAASNTLQFYVRDVAGNDGTITHKAYVLDTTPPTTSITSIEFSDDSGSSNSDFITNIGTQTISGTLSANLEPGEMVYVSTDNGGSWGLATSDGLDGWSIANSTLYAGDNTLQVKVTDIAGNDATVASQVYLYDSTAPSAASVTPLTTQSLTPVLSGSATLAPGETLTVSVGGAVYDVTPVAGSWSLDLASTVPVSGTLTLLLNQRYNVVATVTDLAGNSSNDTTSNELTVGVITPPPQPPAPAPAPTPTPPPAPVPVDGVPVTTTPGPGGSTLITVPVITPSRPDTPGSPSSLADIPLVTSSGHLTLGVSLPIGTGLQTDGFSTSLLSHDAALAALIARIEAQTDDSSGLIQGAQTFLASLLPDEPLAVQRLTPVAGAGFNPNNALTITGSNAPADGKQAIILDARNLPAGSVIQLNHVDFAAIVGNVTLRGGDGQNFVVGDGASQNIILGADDDIIHGGGGNDTVGSRGGNDQIYGDEGDDIVFGGAGNDILSGGSGSDRLNGGTGFDVALQEGKRSDYSITLDGAGIKLTHIATSVADWLVDVEQVRFETGPILTVAHSAAEEAAAFLFQKWMGRDLTQSEGAVIQTLDGLSAVQVADLFAQVFPQQAGGRTAQQLLEGMEAAGAIRVDADRSTKYVGDAGDNTFAPTLGLAWTVDGGAGIDTLVFPATLAQTYIDASTTGFTLQRMADGAMLELINVERLTFSDTKLALDLDGHAGQAAKLLGALGGVGLLDNKPLVGEVIRALDAGISAQSLAQLGLQVLGVHTPGQVTQLLWTNVVGSAPTPAQLQPFIDMMAQGVTGGELAVLASNLELNATRIDLVGLAATGIEFA